ncbi:hypothetical protein E8E13_003921 [Curvularia kusanoi]|uniref:Major facilitator superfamily (MFS) profile domain-containing protein n=1 Tax=Curvularia kusanoi TaxID=90978 RepID=A0A9P4TGB0_CURKU|nr:hypothetical protein E8E13_003921 [Curvularia kusanoi]
MSHAPETAPLLGNNSSHSTTLPPSSPTSQHPPLQDVSRQLAFKISAAMFSFFTLGLFNSSIGALLPSLSTFYSLTDTHVSLIFLVGPVGYILAAQTSSVVHYYFGQFGVALAGPLLQLVAAAVLATHPKFGLVLLGAAVQGLGTGLLDGSWCAWAGAMESASTVSGLLHGSYSVGAAVAPVIVTLMVERGRGWWEWYYVLAVLAIVETAALVSAFWGESAAAYRQNHPSEDTKPRSKEVLKYLATWVCAAYFLADVGVETAISGWIVSFMLRSRSASSYLAGLSSSGFWAGMAVGRLVLGPLTDRLGVRRATALYFALAVLTEVLFAVLHDAVVSVLLMVVLGFLMGPLFPSGVIVLTQLLPVELHVAAVSFVASLGQVGGALLPFGIGAVVEGLGIGVFRYAILVQSVLAMLLWVIFARLRPAVFAAQRSSDRED